MTQTTNYTPCMKNYYIYRDIIFALSFGRAADHTYLIIFFNLSGSQYEKNAKNNPLNYENTVENFS